MKYEELVDLACKHFEITKANFDNSKKKQGVINARMSIANELHNDGYANEEIAVMMCTTKETISRYLLSFDDRVRYDYDFKSSYFEFKKEIR